jgi:undecaprenyl pyrophosphate phosphatase UppP
MDEGDPHDEIVRLEARIEELETTIESCRKFILAARIAMATGGILLFAILYGAIRYDLVPTALVAAMAALLGGIVVWGSNGSTAKEAAGELTAAEANRAALIGLIDLRVIAGGETLH